MEDLIALGLENAKGVSWNLEPAELVTEAIKNGEGVLTNTGALMCDTGKFTDRSSKDRFIVKDRITKDKVWWGDINIAFDEKKFDKLYKKMVESLGRKRLYIRDAFAGADRNYRMNIRVIDTKAWHNLFCYNMFIRPCNKDLKNFSPDFTVLSIPEFKADPEVDGTRQSNFAIINMTKRIILVGGTGYTGETKKGIFSVLNFLLPDKKQILSMQCSANVGKNGDTAIFFGLSGTGKTTLSADPNRFLVGDDEHGWNDKGIFNFEGGCYAKTINLTREKEPEIYDAIKFGSILENTRFYPGTNDVDYSSSKITENTRVSYPIDHIENALQPSIGGNPKNIFLLTCDANGIFPPISKLTIEQAMYHFISGYTADVAGMETGNSEPKSVFSACFGAPFMPLHPAQYAELLGEKIRKNKVNIWLVNTGWSGGPYGVGERIRLRFTRAMITAALEKRLEGVQFKTEPIFGLKFPTEVQGVPSEILNPRNTWKDQGAYDRIAEKLALKFIENFKKFGSYTNEEVLSGAPKVGVMV
ncbi:MAG: phosphoenolpyruvate carboxykinase (ATP) [Bacteroidota bacterium]